MFVNDAFGPLEVQEQEVSGTPTRAAVMVINPNLTPNLYTFEDAGGGTHPGYDYEAMTSRQFLAETMAVAVATPVAMAAAAYHITAVLPDPEHTQMGPETFDEEAGAIRGRHQKAIADGSRSMKRRLYPLQGAEEEARNTRQMELAAYAEQAFRAVNSTKCSGAGCSTDPITFEDEGEDGGDAADEQ